MKIIKIDLKNEATYKPAIEEAVALLEKDGIVILPTDTVYGMATNATEPFCIHKIFRIKKRPETKPIPVLIDNIEMAKKLAFIDKKKEDFLKKVWPGAVTVVLEKRDVVPSTLTAKTKTVGLRIPDCLFVQKLVQAFGKPITATSANFSGEPPLNSAQEVIRIFSQAEFKPDLIIDAGDLPNELPSTVIDLSKEEPMILRQGPIMAKDLIKVFKKY